MIGEAAATKYRSACASVLPVPGVNPTGPYSTMYPTVGVVAGGVNVTNTSVGEIPIAVRLLTGKQLGVGSTVMLSTKDYYQKQKYHGNESG